MAIPIVPLLAFGAVGAVVGGQINRAIYRWAWNQRSISPWSQKPDVADPRTWSDCVPVLGWWRLRREAPIHGRGFWLRPACIELAWMVGLPWFYGWSVVGGGQLAVPLQPAGQNALVATFIAHAVMLGLMTIATFIDFDEKTIPDFVTVPGALFALIFVSIFPNALLPIGLPPRPLLLIADAWPASLDRPSTTGLAIALACWIGWCLALVPVTIYFRRGMFFWLKLLIGSAWHPRRRKITLGILGMLVIGAAAITLLWQTGGLHWQALLTSLVGLAAAGGLIWAIRIVAGNVLGVEAMGFGDVTLMFMIGAFLGWQAAMISFVLAPFTSVGIAGAQWLLTGKKQIAFGPFLCAGTTIVVLCWADIWQAWGNLFMAGMAGFTATIIAACIVLMGIMLAVLQVIKRLLGLR